MKKATLFSKIIFIILLVPMIIITFLPLDVLQKYTAIITVIRIVEIFLPGIITLTYIIPLHYSKINLRVIENAKKPTPEQVNQKEVLNEKYQSRKASIKLFILLCIIPWIFEGILQVRLTQLMPNISSIN